MQPWDFVVVRGAREAYVHGGVVSAWRRIAALLHQDFELRAGEVGAYDSVALVSRIAAVQEHIEGSDSVAWLATGARNIALGEWSNGPVDVSEQGVFIDGSRVRTWDRRVAVTERGAVPVPHALAKFAQEAMVVPVSQSQAWGRHLSAVARALAGAPLAGSVRIEHVAGAVDAGTVSFDEETQGPPH